MRGSTGVAAVGAVLAVVSGVEVLTHGPLDKLDDRVAWNYWPITWTASTHTARFLNDVGQPWIACVVVGLLAGIVTVVRRQRSAALGAVVGLGCVGLTTQILKLVFPHLSVLGHQSGSFPSGHTGVAVVASGLVIYLLLPSRPWREPAVLTVAAIWGAVMAWGRLVIEAHWLSDVIAGWGIGMAVLVLALRLADSPLGNRGWARSTPDDR